jgi:hypothetical protein
VRLLLRADSGFCREDLMAWCEANRVDYVFGLARNPRLTGEIATEMAAARAAAERTGKPARRFKDVRWSTRDSWSRIRRVIGKAEWTAGEANPRFIVTSLPATAIDARRLYERVYCARGAMENRIKACQLDRFADRTSAATMPANQVRLWFASLADVRLCALRRIGLAFTQFARASCGRIRRTLLKIGALVRVSVRQGQRAPDPSRHGLGVSVSARVCPGACRAAPRRRLNPTNQTPQGHRRPNNASRGWRGESAFKIQQIQHHPQHQHDAAMQLNAAVQHSNRV